MHAAANERRVSLQVAGEGHADPAADEATEASPPAEVGADGEPPAVPAPPHAALADRPFSRDGSAGSRPISQQV